MSITGAVATDDRLARLLQIGVVLEQIVGTRAERHLERLGDQRESIEPAIELMFAETAEESDYHRDRLAAMIAELEADPDPHGGIKALVRERYDETAPTNFEETLVDQRQNKQSAYTFYDDLIDAIQATDTSFRIDRTKLLKLLRAIRDEEAEGVEEVESMLQQQP